MPKVAILKFKKNGTFTTEICESDCYNEKMQKPGLYGVIGLNEVVKENGNEVDETLKEMESLEEKETEQ